MSIIKAWGLLTTSPYTLSQSLRQLRVSHSVIRGSGPNLDRLDIDGLSNTQPAWPIILHSISDFNYLHKIEKDPLIAFVFDSPSAFMSTNISVLDHNFQLSDLPDILNTRDEKPFVLQQNEISAMDYIRIASKPSILSTLHTTWCRINPYQLRKEIEMSIIAYLSGKLKLSTIQNKIQSTLRGEELVKLLRTKECNQLKSGVIQALKSPDQSETIADKLGLDSFDITFVMTSLKKIHKR